MYGHCIQTLRDLWTTGTCIIIIWRVVNIKSFSEIKAQKWTYFDYLFYMQIGLWKFSERSPQAPPNICPHFTWNWFFGLVYNQTLVMTIICPMTFPASQSILGFSFSPIQKVIFLLQVCNSNCSLHLPTLQLCDDYWYI